MTERSTRSLEFAARLEKRRKLGTQSSVSGSQPSAAFLKEKADRLMAQIAERTPADWTAPRDSRLLEAEDMAALVSRFEPDALVAALRLEEADRTPLLTVLASLCSVQAAGKRTVWMLHTDRRSAALKRLIEEGRLADALSRTLPLLDIASRMLQDVLRGSPIDVQKLGHDELLGLAWALEVLGDLPLPKPAMAGVQSQLAQDQFLADYGVLLSKGFVGRDEQLRQLSAFLEMGNRDGELLLLSGMGGSGKSTLIARFARDTVASSKATVVVLDFDRPGIDPQDTLGLEMEMARQVGAQLPEADQTLRGVREEVRRGSGTRNLNLSFSSDAEEASRGYRANLLFPIANILTPRARPLLLIFDTFEEVARRDLIDGVVNWFNEVSSALYGIPVRGILCGRLFEETRGQLQPYVSGEVVVGEFSPALAEQFLSLCGVSGPVAQRLIESNLMPLRPLELKLLAKLITDGRAGSVEDLEQELRQGGAAAKDLFAGLVYRRVLLRVAVPEEMRDWSGAITDDVLRSLAYPGLVLRYVTADVIRSVLVPGLGMPPLTGDQATLALDLLARHEWLAFREGDRVWHRRDLRRSVLKPMIAENPERARAIHHLAVTKFDDADDSKVRAEAYYHRLMLMTGEPQEPAFDIRELAKAAPLFQVDEVDLPPVGAALLTYAATGDVELEKVRLLPPGIRAAAYTSKGTSLVDSREFGQGLKLYFDSNAPLADWERTLLYSTAEWDRLGVRLGRSRELHNWRELGEYLLPAVVTGPVDLDSLTEVFEKVSYSGPFRTGSGTPLQWLAVALCMIARDKPLTESALRLVRNLLKFSVEMASDDPVLEKSLLFLRLCAPAENIERLPIASSTIFLDPEWLNAAPQFLASCGVMTAPISEFLNKVQDLILKGTGAQRTASGLLSYVQFLSERHHLTALPNPDREALLRYLELPRPEFRDPARFALMNAFPAETERTELGELFASAVPFPLDDLAPEVFAKAIALAPEHALATYVELADRAGVLEKLLNSALRLRPQNRKLESVLQAVRRWRDAAREAVIPSRQQYSEGLGNTG